MKREREGFWQREQIPEDILHHVVRQDCSEKGKNAGKTENLPGKQEMKDFPLLTLYLSTMGSLTGPSLDLLKFGKLSRWAINGKPLIKKRELKQKEQ